MVDEKIDGNNGNGNMERKPVIIGINPFEANVIIGEMGSVYIMHERNIRNRTNAIKFVERITRGISHENFLLRTATIKAYEDDYYSADKMGNKNIVDNSGKTVRDVYLADLNLIRDTKQNIRTAIPETPKKKGR